MPVGNGGDPTIDLSDESALVQVGHGFYDTTSRKWISLPGFYNSKAFHRVPGSLKTLYPASALNTSARDFRSSGKPEKPDTILSKHPELAPAKDLLSECASLSDSVARHATVHEPLAQSLFAFGTAVPWRRPKKPDDGGVRVAAFAGGPLREEVHLVPVYDEIIKRKGLQINVPDIHTDECHRWCEGRSPIQQLCVSKAGLHPGSHLAVRRANGTTVLRICRQDRPPQTRDVEPSHIADGPSWICLQPITFVDVAATKDAHHAFVSFNPQDEHQFVIMATDGRWTVWRLEGCCNIDLSRCKAIVTAGGSREGEYIDHAPSPDGWGHASWIGSSDCLMTATRTSMSFSSTAYPAKQLIFRDEDLGSDTAWILDLKPHPYEADVVLVLTTLQVLCLRVRTDGAGHINSTSGLSADVLRTILHHRGATDSRLRLHLEETDQKLRAPSVDGRTSAESGLFICVRAKASPLLTCFYLDATQTASQTHWACEPFGLTISDSPTRHPLAELWAEPETDLCGAIDMHLTALRAERINFPDGRSSQHNIASVAILHALVLHSDFSVTRELFSATKDMLCLEDLSRRGGNVVLPCTPGQEEPKDFVIPDSCPPQVDYTLRRHINSPLIAVESPFAKVSEEAPMRISWVWFATRLQNTDASSTRPGEAPEFWLGLHDRSRPLHNAAWEARTLFDSLCDGIEREQDPWAQVHALLLEAARQSSRSYCREASALLDQHQSSELLQVWDLSPIDVHPSDEGYFDLLPSLREYILDRWIVPASDHNAPAPKLDDIWRASVQLLLTSRSKTPAQSKQKRMLLSVQDMIATLTLDHGHSIIHAALKGPKVIGSEPDSSGPCLTPTSQVELTGSQQSGIRESNGAREWPPRMLGQHTASEKQVYGPGEVIEDILGDWDVGMDPRDAIGKGTSQQRSECQSHSLSSKPPTKSASSHKEGVHVSSQGLASSQSRAWPSSLIGPAGRPEAALPSPQKNSVGIPVVTKSQGGTGIQTSQNSQSAGQSSSKQARPGERDGF